MRIDSFKWWILFIMFSRNRRKLAITIVFKISVRVLPIHSSKRHQKEEDYAVGLLLRLCVGL